MVLITTGSQGESMAALSRMAANIHRKVSIKPGDTVIFSSNPIPGNEKAVSRVINELSCQGCRCYFPGCTCIRTCLPGRDQADLLSGTTEICDSGSWRIPSSESTGRIAESLGIPKENIFILRSGDVLELDDEDAEIVDKVQTGAILVDGLGVGDVGNIVLRDRQHLAEDGIMIVVLTLEKYSNQLLAGPDIVSRGFVYVRESEDLMGQAKSVVEDAIDSCLDRRM